MISIGLKFFSFGRKFFLYDVVKKVVNISRYSLNWYCLLVVLVVIIFEFELVINGDDGVCKN